MTCEAPAPVLARGDEDLMREGLSNLVDNTIKFTPEAGVVRIAAGTEDGRPVVSVSDSGRGVPPEERVRIFRRSTGSSAKGRPRHRAQHRRNDRAAAGFQLSVEDNARRAPDSSIAAPTRGRRESGAR
ncbi:MAG: ATP-binding protein [Bradyrhizobium sp.]|uniref:ATP-binding protein n=1 Tax=Bradyrhizobium sp. TaxID=376 RepID=UPI001C299457|nr:ATP-binding protein [Bradyrhizobium sp.]MBU6463267.1 ATP-binding protein [Pseudomonadota bacterium]MDE2066626.1 ATP-binding protein [Bradyrhizobium sp.]